MANIVCDFETPCLQPDYTNLSAEAPDQNFFWGFNWGDPQNDPPLNSEWQDWSCLGVCESTVSQAAADQCAAVAQAECLLNGGPPLGTSPTNGNPPANYPGRHPASPNPASIPPFSGLCCVGVPFPPFQLKATAFKTPFLFEMVAGELPPGMVMVNGTLSGTPTQAGMFYFTVQVTDRTGATVTQPITFEVLGFNSPSTLPSAQSGMPYLFQLDTAGIGVKFLITVGTLPSGLVLDPDTGLISGTCNSPVTKTFTVETEDVFFNQCDATFTLTVTSPALDWTQMVWDTVNFSSSGSATATGSAVGKVITFDLEGADNGSGSAVADIHGTLPPYTGPLASGQLDLFLSGIQFPGGATVVVQIIQDGVPVLTVMNASNAFVLGHNLFPFTIAAGVNSIIEVQTNNGIGSYMVAFSQPFPPAATIVGTVTLS
jgi:hypothetical protein